MNIPFALRIGLAIFGICGTLTISVSLIIYNQISGSIWNGMSSRLKDFNRLALSQIKPDQIETIINLKSLIETKYPVPQDIMNNLNSGETLSLLPKEDIDKIQRQDDFQDIIQYLRRVKFSTAQNVVPKENLAQAPANKLDIPLVRYVYILTDIPGVKDYKILRFIADGDYETIDIDDNGMIDNDEISPSIGQLYNTVGQPGIEEAFKGSVSSNPEYTMDQWGIWITSYGPIFDNNGKIIAILGIDMNAKGEFNLFRKLRIVIVVVIILSIFLSFLAGYIISIYFNKPISALIKGVDSVSKENYDYHVDIKSKDELGLLANTFNLMVDSVKEMKSRLQDYTESLEEKVEKRTIELKQSYKELKASQNQLIQSEKMAALGQLIAGIAHEINTPIGAIKANAGNINNSIKDITQITPNLMKSLDDNIINKIINLIDNTGTNKEIFTTKEERKIKKELIEKFNKNGIENSDDICQYLIDIKIVDLSIEDIMIFKHPKSSDIIKYIYNMGGLKIKTKNIETSVDKTSKIVYALKSYSHKDHAGNKQKANIINGIETVLIIYQNYLKQGIDIVKDYEDIPEILCYLDELNQVWTNLIHNSIQAMNNKGIIWINVCKKFMNENTSSEAISITIRDNGSGIPEDILDKIFEPFFTTKNAGEGSGLGLHICKQIIDKHNGIILVRTGKDGTAIEIMIPIQ
jgi:signal transduction histidine kinase